MVQFCWRSQGSGISTTDLGNWVRILKLPVTKLHDLGHFVHVMNSFCGFDFGHYDD